MWKHVFWFAWSVVFGVMLSRSGFGDYEFIQQMFLFESFHLYGALGTAVFATGVGLWLLKRHGRTITGEPIVITPKPVNRGNIVGGICFGIGWSMTGMCPGPIFVNLGEGKLYAVAALVGTLFGTWLLGVLRPRLAGPMGLDDVGAAPP